MGSTELEAWRSACDGHCSRTLGRTVLPYIRCHCIHTSSECEIWCWASNRVPSAGLASFLLSAGTIGCSRWRGTSPCPFAQGSADPSLTGSGSWSVVFFFSVAQTVHCPSLTVRCVLFFCH